MKAEHAEGKEVKGRYAEKMEEHAVKM